MFPELITELLQEGYKVNFSAPGHSMFPTIMANETIMVEPIDPAAVKPGDIILYRTNNHLIAHRVVKIDKKNDSAIAENQIKGDSPLLERSAPQTKRSSSEALREAVSPLLKRSVPQIPLKAGCSSSEALQHSAQSSVLFPSSQPPSLPASRPPSILAQSSVLIAQHFFTFRGDASVTCDAPVTADQILGKVVAIERNGCSVDPYSFKHKLRCLAHSWVNRLKRYLN
jgi:hypothetical protein